MPYQTLFGKSVKSCRLFSRSSCIHGLPDVLLSHEANSVPLSETYMPNQEFKKHQNLNLIFNPAPTQFRANLLSAHQILSDAGEMFKSHLRGY